MLFIPVMKKFKFKAPKKTATPKEAHSSLEENLELPKTSKRLLSRKGAISLAFLAGAALAAMATTEGRVLSSAVTSVLSFHKSQLIGDSSAGDTDISLDDAVGAATTATELSEDDNDQPEVNEFAQDEDDDTSPIALATPAPVKQDIDLSYMTNMLTQAMSPETRFVEAEQPVVSPDWEFDRDEVLDDKDNRIAKDFHIPALLHDRVGFWFDVYTKWDNNHRIIHNSRYPWIVFEVVDVKSIVEAELPKHQWMRVEKADKLVKADAEKVRKALRTLSKKRPGAKLTDEEQSVADALAPLGGDVHKQAARALGEVRIQTGQRNFFQGGLTVSQSYLNTMEEIFKKQKLPMELTRIPLVESSFNKTATSKVGASGIWQFMGNTGRKFMLVNDVIDERRSPFKASEAAARLLKENHLILRHSWPLAITAWNHGPGGVRKAAKAAGSFDLGVIVKKYRSRSFDFASSNFYSEFLAALHAERYSDLTFPPMEHAIPLELEVVRLHKAVHVKELLKVTGMTMDDFLMINPDLSSVAKRNLQVPIGFRVHVPTATRMILDKRFAIGIPIGPKKETQASL